MKSCVKICLTKQTATCLLYKVYVSKQPYIQSFIQVLYGFTNDCEIPCCILSLVNYGDMLTFHSSSHLISFTIICTKPLNVHFCKGEIFGR